VLVALRDICSRRALSFEAEETMRAAAAPSSAPLQKRWEDAVGALGLAVHRMPSGAGHDAMKLHQALPQALLFVRGLNSGISHNPLEAVTNDDCDLAVRAFMRWIDDLALESA
jgi:N-carbamoyl-L-amino-acid hydrolase